jgi:hypothetical protein
VFGSIKTPSSRVWTVLLAVAALACALVVREVVGAPASGRPAHRSLDIRGNASEPLRPGLSQPLRLRLRNRRGVPLLVVGLHVRARVDRRHRQAGCTRRDFAVRQLPAAAFPFRLAPRVARPLERMAHRLPRLRMKNLPTRNQDACKGARLHLRYRARTVPAR